jgi:hypothetical protein
VKHKPVYAGALSWRKCAFPDTPPSRELPFLHTSIGADPGHSSVALARSTHRVVSAGDLLPRFIAHPRGSCSPATPIFNDDSPIRAFDAQKTGQPETVPQGVPEFPSIDKCPDSPKECACGSALHPHHIVSLRDWLRQYITSRINDEKEPRCGGKPSHGHQVTCSLSTQKHRQ